jgi:hypothetical protein
MQSRFSLAYVWTAAYERSGQAHRNLAGHARQHPRAVQLGLERAGSIAQQQAPVPITRSSAPRQSSIRSRSYLG